MPARSSFDYAIIHIVPRVERGEYINAGVILFCRTQRYLAARTALDEPCLRALGGDLPLSLLRASLECIERIAAGAAGSGPIGTLGQAERFHWLVSPSSTVIQTSPVHSGLCGDPETQLLALFDELVRRPPASDATRSSGPPFSPLWKELPQE